MLEYALKQERFVFVFFMLFLRDLVLQFWFRIVGKGFCLRLNLGLFWEWLVVKVVVFDDGFDFRAKYHKLKYGTDLDPSDEKYKSAGYDDNTTGTDGDGGGGDAEAPFTSVSNISWRQGRQLLRQ